MAFEQLLAWAAGRPIWQKDALRRLAEHGELTNDDLAELRSQVETAEGLEAEEPPKDVPLAAKHLTEASSNAPKTVLASLGPINHIDQLESGQPPMRFAINGITLIYGPNASGKSGYCRITKQLCRSLSPDALRGNVFDEAEPPQAEVNVAFRVGGDDDPKVDLTWRSGDPPPPELGRISVFDTASARVYVDKERKIEFLPYELDLLNKLALAARALDHTFKTRGEALGAAIRTPLPTGYVEGTTAHRLIANLVPATALDDLVSEKGLRDTATWSEESQAELDSLAEQVKNNPIVVKDRRIAARQAFQTLQNDVLIVEQILGDPAIEALSRKRQDVVNKNDAAEASAHDLFKYEPVPNVGSEAWRDMLRYAREFAAEIFPDGDPPRIATATQCVLCQQDLDETAASRLAAFDSYLGQRAAEEAATTMREFEDSIAAIRSLVVKSKREIYPMLGGYGALIQLSNANGKAIALFFEKAGERLQRVTQILNEQTFDDLDTLVALPPSPTPLIDEVITSQDRKIEQFRPLERGDEAASKHAQNHDELADRKRFSEEIDLIVERRDRLEEFHRVTACRAQCLSTTITQQITKRRRDILTPSLKDALGNELEALQLTHIPIDLTDRGDMGSSIVEVALTARQRIATNSEVLSEGEHRGLALACFLAELIEIGSNHGIIVDDPASSLDHSRMDAVARRLAEEAAKGRQVIVFTHNILFHSMLTTEARRCMVPCHEEWMTSHNNRFGIIDDAQKPWHMKTAKQRLAEVGQDLIALSIAGYDRRDEKHRKDVANLYAKMRTTWERVVEEILFNKVVQRFRPEVMTQSLKTACFDTEHDYPTIFEGMKRTSHFSGHDLAEDIAPELPTFEDIDRDINTLRDFAIFARKRRTDKEKGMKAYEGGAEAILL